MADYRVIGQPLLRVDAAEKATGKAVYTGDLKLPHMLYGKVLRSPYPHALIRRIDTSRAEKMPGVKAVLTYKDGPQHRTGLMLQDHYIFAKDKVRCVGDEIAAVAAVDEETAQRAVDAIEVEYEELPAVFDIEEAMKPAAPIIHEDLRQYTMGAHHHFATTMEAGTNVCGHFTLSKGDIAQGFREADYIFEDTFRTHSFHHGYMEPHACVASVDASGKVTVWSSTQRPFLVQAYLSDTFDLPMNKIRVVGTRVGGGFGGKTRPRHERFPVALTLKTGRPIKMVMTRDEDFVTYRAPSSVIKLKIGVKKDGTLVAFKIDMIWDTGAYGESVHYARGPLNALTGPYVIPHLQVDSYAVYTNKLPGYSYRGRIMPQPTFAVESAMDMIAEKLDLDALQVRMKNLVEEGSLNASSQVLRAVGVKECFRKVAENIGWGRKLGTNRGMALMAYHKYPPGETSSAIVRLNDDGSVQLLCGAPEIGQGAQTALSMICAEELGVGLDDVSMPMYDTDHTPYESGAIGDRITTTCGNAIRIAAAEAREQVLTLAAQALKVNKPDLAIGNGRVFVKDAPEMWTSLADVCTSAHRMGGPIMGKGTYSGGMSLDFDRPGGVAHIWKYGAQAAEVEVDRDTGEVKIIKLVCAQDVGKAINPLSLEGQMDGAALMGLGLTLWEKTHFDGGQVLNPSFMDYRIPTSMESVKIDRIIVEQTSPDGPFGAKGAGEQSTVGIAPVLANAIYNAVGVRFKELPLTPEAVLAALEKDSNKGS